MCDKNVQRPNKNFLWEEMEIIQNYVVGGEMEKQGDDKGRQIMNGLEKVNQVLLFTFS